MKTCLTSNQPESIRKSGSRNTWTWSDQRSGWLEIWRVVLHDRKAIIGLIILISFTTVALLAPYIAPYDPFALIGDPYQPPGSKHILGTDNLGRDVLSQVIWGTRVSLFVGAVVALA
ncbi:MAG: ABC transporter permease, partial [Thermoproteota archaeon]